MEKKSCAQQLQLYKNYISQKAITWNPRYQILSILADDKM